MDKMSNNEELRKWSDHIPLEWKYTAGVAGDRFLLLLRQGKVQASYCKNCNKLYLPPKIFCKDCFAQLNEWKDVDTEAGFIYSFTTMRNGETIVLVKFDGVDGGLLGKFKHGREEPRISMKVKAVFKPREERKGELADIAYFEKTNL